MSKSTEELLARLRKAINSTPKPTVNGIFGIKFPNRSITIENDELLLWMHKQELNTLEIDNLCIKHPGLAEKRNEYLAMLALVREEEKTNGR